MLRLRSELLRSAARQATRSQSTVLPNRITRYYAQSLCPLRYAAVEHAAQYIDALHGRHGNQLELARLEGVGKDDPPFDPFLEEELEEERLRAAIGIEDEEIEGEEGIPDKPPELDEEAYDSGYDGELESEAEDDKPLYKNDGSLRRAKSELATLRAGYPSGGAFAIIELAGSQHKITEDDVLIVNRLKPIDTFKVGSIHTLTDVLLVSSSHLTLVGMPTVAGAEVDVLVEEITKDAKTIVFKKRRRKNSQTKNGFRRDVTMLRVIDIRFPGSYAGHEHIERPAPHL